MARNSIRYCIQAADGKFLKITPEKEALPYFSPQMVGPEVVSKPYDYKSVQKAQIMLEYIREYTRINTRSQADRNDPIVRRDWRYTKYVDGLVGAQMIEIPR